jgi:peptidoglycan/LPS O-acetylase OafA/YrhL
MVFYSIWPTAGLELIKTPPDLGCVLTTLTFTNGWNGRWINRIVPGGWSIAVEMNFYLLVPFLFRVVRDRRAALIGTFAALGGAAASAFAVGLARRLLGPEWDGVFRGLPGFWLPFQMPIFFLGFTLFYLLKPTLRGGDEGGPSRVADGWLMLGLSVYLMVATSFSTTNLYLGHMLFGIAFLLLGWSLCLYPNPLLVNRAMCHLGKVSYSAYLTHFAVLDLVLGATRHPSLGRVGSVPPTARFLIELILVVACTTAVSTVTHHLIEVPGINAGRKLIRAIEARERRARLARETASPA